MEIILASNSPRRKELLEKAGIKFKIEPSDFEEKVFSLDPFKTAETFAVGKAKAVLRALDGDYLVIGADTVVFLDGEILGKPKDEEHAKKMLKSLSNKMHTVVTGYALLSNKKVVSGFVQTQVTFNHLSNKIIDEYVKSGYCWGKAGSYGIQDPFPLVKEYNGSLSNVIGLPVETIIPLIEKFK